MSIAVDRILIGTVVPLTADGARHEAIAIHHGRVFALGSEAEMLALAGERTTIDRFEGGFILPGFHDAHVHLSGHGLALQALDLHAIDDFEEALGLIGARATGDTWLECVGFGLDRFGLSEVGPAERARLTKMAPHTPVLIRAFDRHSIWLNEVALQQAGITADTPDPVGGKIVRDADGNPTGLLLETATDLADAALPAPTGEDLVRTLRMGAYDLAKHGITTVHDMGALSAAQWRATANSASHAEFPVRVWGSIPHAEIEAAQRIGLATGQGGEHFLIGGAKFFVDGALGSHTAWMLEPYEGTEQTGISVDGPEVLRERIPLAIEAGLTPVIHAIGDAANRAIIDVLEETYEAWSAAGMRPRIEHAQHLHIDDVHRILRLGIIPSMQPIHLTFDAPIIRRWLPDRVERAYQFRTLKDGGARIPLGSDTPVAPPGVLADIVAATTMQARDGSIIQPEQAMTIPEALWGHTRDAAWAIGQEHVSGVLAPGFVADVVVLSADPYTALEDAHVRFTMKAGKMTFKHFG